nr:MAG TPA: hypothetical protein [Caudoviricetes sp.]
MCAARGSKALVSMLIHRSGVFLSILISILFI